MESGVALEMVTNLYNESDNHLFIEYLVSDDESSMRSHLRHIENGGKLAAMFRSQPSLQTQVTGSKLCAAQFIKRLQIRKIEGRLNQIQEQPN